MYLIIRSFVSEFAFYRFRFLIYCFCCSFGSSFCCRFFCCGCLCCYFLGIFCICIRSFFCFFFFYCLIGYSSISCNGLIRFVISLVTNFSVYITLDYPVSCLFCGGIRNNLCKNAYMVCTAVFICIEENQITDICFILSCFFKTVAGVCFQLVDPIGTVSTCRNLRYICIVETEGSKHGIPVFIRASVPGSVSGITFDGTAV